MNEIALADLWIAPGDAIVLPPKVAPVPPNGSCDEDPRRLILDMHGNRNSALACWSSSSAAGDSALLTTTILANEAAMMADATKPHYHEEKNPSMHGRPQAIRKDQP